MRSAFFHQSSKENFDTSFVQKKLEEISSLYQEENYDESSLKLHELDNYLMGHEFDKNLLPNQRKVLSDLYTKIGDINFTFGNSPDGKEDPGGIQAFLYLQKARKLDPSNEISKKKLRSMWAESQIVSLKQVESGEWPPSPFKMEG